MKAKAYTKPNGASAQSIWIHLCGGPDQQGDYPRDEGDFGRCEAFLYDNPELRPRLSEMSEVNAYWAALVPRWDDIKAKHDGAARYALIRDIVAPIQRADPSHMGPAGGGFEIRTGPITFKGTGEPPKPKHQTLEDVLDDMAALDAGDGQGMMTHLLKEGPTRLPFNKDVMTAQVTAGLSGRKMTRAEVDAILAKQGADPIDEAAEAHARKGKKPIPLKTDSDFRKHNQDAYNIAAEELRQFIERIEQLDAEKADIAEQAKEVMAEAKGRGYDTKVIRKVIALRKRKPDDIAEEEAILDMYKAALGMA